MRKERRQGIIALLFVICYLLFVFSGCSNGENGDPNPNPDPGNGNGVHPNPPLLLVHYMPWFRGPSDITEESITSTYGYHWRNARAAETLPDGRADIPFAQYPLTGPYHSSNPDLLDYQVSLFIIAGIDGVIFDWYGAYNSNDFGENQGYTIAMADTLIRAGLQFCVMYEDNTLNMMGLQSNREEGMRRGKISMDWLENGTAAAESFGTVSTPWFKHDLYVKYDGRPLLFNFGPQYFNTKADWDTLFEGLGNRPYYVDLDNRNAFADASFPWPPMHMSGQLEPGIVTMVQLDGFMGAFYRSRQRNRPYKITSVWPAFDSHLGRIEYNNGAVFDHLWEMAIDFEPNIIQLVTWNDFQEGTCIEPSIERGYNELEYIQSRVKEWDSSFPYTKEDLRWPLEFYKLRYTQTATAAQEAAIKAATDALFAGNVTLYREKAAETGVTIDMNDVKPLLRNN